jgi:hypothetical protein
MEIEMVDIVDGIDPDVKIPAGVRAAAQHAEEMHKQTYAPADPEPSEPAPVDPAPEPPLDAKKPDPQPEPVTSTGNEGNWEHRYNSMKGRYERAEQELRRVTSERAELERLLAELSAAPKAPPAEAPLKLLTPEEEADYGAELLTVVGKKAQEVVTPEVAQLRQQLSKIEAQLQTVQGTVVRSAQEKMFDYLDAQVPAWRDINYDENFLRWLGLPDVFSGAIRKDLLGAAFQRNDAQRVAAFFTGFISDEAATNPAGRQPVESVTSAGNAAQKPTLSLEQLAAPGRAKTAAANAPAEKPVISRADIQKFYADVRAGAYRSREQDKDRFEKLIFEASRDGRIR